MDKHYSYRAIVPPVTESKVRPLWSVMIPTYNCAAYLRETLASVLIQDPGAEIMQIEVIDDHSTQDDLARIVEELGRGRVSFYQQPQNVGHIKNFQTCLERSRGQLVHLLHGDDCVRNGFYRTMQRGFDQHPEIGASFCRHIIMDEQGHWQYVSWLEQSEPGILDHWLERIAVEQRIQTPSIVVRRAVYEQLGGFDRRLTWTEDWEMWVRIAAQYPVWYEPQALALYRIHSNSSSGQKTRSGENMRDVRRSISIFQAYLPETNAAKLVQKARENWAIEAIYTASIFVNQQDFTAAMTQIREALKCRCSLVVIQKIVGMSLRLILEWFEQIMKNKPQDQKSSGEAKL